MITLKWESVEDIDGNMSFQNMRAKVPSGWLVTAWTRSGITAGITFVPDPNHEWK